MAILLILLLGIIEPPGKPLVKDAPNDEGSKIMLTWQPTPQIDEIDGYDIYRAKEGESFELIGSTDKWTTKFTDTKTHNGIKYQNIK